MRSYDNGCATGRLRRRLAPALVCGISTLWPPSPQTASAQSVVGETRPLIQSPNDRRHYRTLRLANQLRVLLVSDPDSAVAGAAVNVSAGSGADPAERPGLAHFLEHMLFLGTEKYPQAGGFETFLAARGGRSNARTGFASSSYYFTVDGGQLAPALDRFAQFFSAPLLPAHYVERERHAVDAEYRGKRNEDSWRRLHVLKQTLNPDHPYSRFAIGSLQTLRNDSGDAADADAARPSLRDELRAFFQRHYHGGSLTVAVLGREPLDRLERLTRAAFGGVAAAPQRGERRRRRAAPLFREGQLPARLWLAAAGAEPTLTLTFPIPSSDAHFLSKPVRYLSHLIGHEGAGSLLAWLKTRGWADAVNARRERVGREALFNIRLRLTDAGLERHDAVAAQVFRYIDLIRADGVSERLFAEQRRLAELSFRFREDTSPDRYLRFLAANLQRYPDRYLLYGSYAMERYDAALIREYLQYLRPDNVLVTLSSDAAVAAQEGGAAALRREPWFDTPYRLASASAQDWRHAAAAAPRLRMPAANEFLPDDLRVQRAPADRAADRPRRVPLHDRAVFWYRHDATFRVPRADVYLSLRSRRVNSSAARSLLTRLYVRLVNDQLSRYSYPARLGGLNFKLYAHGRGLSIKLSGYRDKQPLLLTRVIEALRSPDLTPGSWRRAHQGLAREIAALDRQRPHRRAVGELKQLLLSGQWSADEQRAALDALRPPRAADQLGAFLEQLFAEAELIGLAHGNLSRDAALSLGRQAVDGLLTGARRPRPAAAVTAAAAAGPVRLAAGAGARRRLPVDHTDSVLVSYYQGDDSASARAGFELLAQLLARPFYDELRTERQLGYIVSAASLPIDDTPGLLLMVQSPGHAPAALDRQVERFLQRFADQLAAAAASEFEAHRQSLLRQQRIPAASLTELSDRYWREIISRRRPFADEPHLTALRQIDRQAVLTLARQLATPERRRLQVWLRGHGAAVATGAGAGADAAVYEIDSRRQLSEWSSRLRRGR